MRALITSGGGAKGAFSVGALHALSQKGYAHYDIISGTSTGSLIAAMAAVGKLQELRVEYSNVSNDNILTKQNIVANLLHSKPYLFDSTPLFDLIRKHITLDVFNALQQPNATTLCLSAISLQTGISTVFTNKQLIAPTNSRYKIRTIASHDELVKALLASSSQPGFFPPVTIDNEQFVDGGNKEVIPSAVVVDLNPDEIIVLSNNPSELFAGKPVYTDVLDITLRAIGIFVQDVRENDMDVIKRYCQTNAKKYYLIEPSQDLDPDYPTGLRFNKLAMALWMSQGEIQANKIIPPNPIIT